MKKLQHFLLDEAGGSAIEYALIAALMGAAIITAMTAFSTSVVNAYTSIGTDLTAKTK